MHIHEFQAKKIFEKYHIPVPRYAVASNEQEVKEAIDRLRFKEAVLKVQVHAGGRGKAGGVKFAKTPDEIFLLSQKLIGMKMVNDQTGPKGVYAEKILITEPVNIKKEYYLAAAIDRKLGVPMIIASREGGVEIEEVAKKVPGKILKFPIAITGKIRNYQLLEIAKFMHWEGETRRQGISIIKSLVDILLDTDSLLIEINPLVETSRGDLFALDAKCTIDDNALYRQKEIASWYDPYQHSQNEVIAQKYNLAYVGLEGNIGCMVNGAGLAMATMDIIHYYGGEPANFLDVGGGASREKVAQGFRIILMDPNVKSIFVNIFGGIMDCAILAAGIVDATREDHVSIPLVVRLEGTHVKEGKAILQESGLNIITADSMDDGAKKAINAKSEK